MKSLLHTHPNRVRFPAQPTLLMVLLALVCGPQPAGAQPLPVSFQEVADSAGVSGAWDGSIALVDFDGDGLLDISAGSRLFRNLGALRFADVSDTVALDPGRVTSWADFNNDGFIDFTVCNWTGGGPRLFRNAGALQFTDITAAAGIAASGHLGSTWIDYNNDGWVDLFLWSPELKLYRNNHDETFSDVTNSVGLPLAWAPDQSATSFDYNNDGYQDLLVTDFWNPSRIFRNNGGITFSDVSAIAGIQMDVSTGIAVGDYDNDGWLDVYLSCYGGSMGDEGRLFRNQGDQTFLDVTDTTGLPLADDGAIQRNAMFHDFNNDGWLDMHETSQGLSGSQTDRLFINNADGTFLDWTDSAGIRDSIQGQFAAAGDLDNDGDLDMFVHNLPGDDSFLYENSGSAGNWIVIRLEGRSANRSAIGARVRLVIDTLVLIREVSAISGFYSQNSPELAFGLGSATIIDTIVVQWPDFAMSADTLVNVPINQHLDIVQEGVSISNALVIVAFSPVDLVVTDPLGDSVGIDSATGVIFNTIGTGSTYDTLSDYNLDLEADDIVTIPAPFTGDYSVRIIREPNVPDTAKFTLGIRINGNQLYIDEDYLECAVSALGTTVPDTYIWTATPTLPGDADADGIVNAADVVYLVNYVFKSGIPPLVPNHGDVDCDDATTAADIVFMVNFVFKSGDPPCSQSAG